MRYKGAPPRRGQCRQETQMPVTKKSKHNHPNFLRRGGDRGKPITMAAKTDNFQSPDYFNVDELLTEEHKLIRESVRNYVKKEISPIIEDYAQRAEFPQQIVKQPSHSPLASLGKYLLRCSSLPY